MAEPKKTRTIEWHEVDKWIRGLETDVAHEICVKREAIPLVFVPGVMGTRLRKAGTNGKGRRGGMPNMRWDPSYPKSWMIPYYAGRSGKRRKEMLVGRTFNPEFLEVHNSDPVGDGFHGIMDAYWKKFLDPLKEKDWGALSKIFEFPVYAFGYNWTDSNANSGQKLAERIKKIIEEAKEITGLCEKVILITHSMGGLVARWAREIADADKSVLGVIHCVQPATGTPAAYWRMKAGFEKYGFLDVEGWVASGVLGPSAREVTPVLANIPGGLQLLPNTLHVTNDGSPQWLTVTENGVTKRALPKSDPYDEIYEVKAVVSPNPGEKPSTNAYWGLVDPDLLDPGKKPGQPSAGKGNTLAAEARRGGDPWSQYLEMLSMAKAFHRKLGKEPRPNTFCLRGVQQPTADVVELRIEASSKKKTDPYETRGFHAYLTGDAGQSLRAVLQDGAGDGDGTVARSSASALDKPGKPFPGDRAAAVKHQPAFEHKAVKKFAFDAIIALCQIRYDERRKSGSGRASPAKAGSK